MLPLRATVNLGDISCFCSYVFCPGLAIICAITLPVARAIIPELYANPCDCLYSYDYCGILMVATHFSVVVLIGLVNHCQCHHLTAHCHRKGSLVVQLVHPVRQ